MTDRQSETNHLLVQIRDLLGDIALSIAGNPDRRPFRYSDTFRRMQAEQSRLEKEHDEAEPRRREEEQFRALIEQAKGYILRRRWASCLEEEYYTNLLNKYPDHPEKWRSNDGELLWEGMTIISSIGAPMRTHGDVSLRAALRKRGRL